MSTQKSSFCDLFPNLFQNLYCNDLKNISCAKKKKKKKRKEKTNPECALKKKKIQLSEFLRPYWLYSVIHKLGSIPSSTQKGASKNHIKARVFTGRGKLEQEGYIGGKGWGQGEGGLALASLLPVGIAGVYQADDLTSADQMTPD